MGYVRWPKGLGMGVGVGRQGVDSPQIPPNVWTNGAGDGLWSTDGNWSLGISPRPQDVALFNDTSVADCEVDADPFCSRLEVDTGYTGTITWTTDGSVEHIIQRDGTIDLGTQTVTNADSFQQTGGILSIGDGGRLDMQGDVTVTGGTITAHANGQIRLTGGAAQSISITPSIPNLTVAKTAGTVATLADDLTVDGTTRIEEGRLTVGANDLTSDTLQIVGGQLNGSNSGVFQRVLSMTGGGIFQPTGQPRTILTMIGVGTISASVDPNAGIIFDGDTTILTSNSWHGSLRFKGTVRTSANRTLRRFHGGANSFVAEPGAVFDLHANGGLTLLCFNGTHGISGEFPGCSFSSVHASGNGIYLQGDVLCWNIGPSGNSHFIRTDNFDLTVQNNLSFGDTTSFQAGSSKVRVGNNFTVHSGATYTHDAGHELILDGAANQDISIDGHNARDITVDKTGGEARFLLAFAMDLFKCQTPGNALRFQALETFTIDTLNIEGSLASPITIDRNGGSGTDRFTWDMQTADQVAAWVDVDNSEISSNSVAAVQSTLGANTDEGEAAPHWFHAQIAEGGTESYLIDGTTYYRLHTYDAGTDDLLVRATVEADYLVVAGGGGGANTGSLGAAGGGGGGGLLQDTGHLFAKALHSILVGAGGAANTQGGSSDIRIGATSVIGGPAIGGGRQHNNGGSGGGGTLNSEGVVLPPGSGTTGQGNNGGTAYPTGETSTSRAGGGGGGAGAVGGNAASSKGGNGGNGIQSSITGTATYYAGGGGGYTRSYSGAPGYAAGGLGGGGNGANGNGPTEATAGVNGLGGGGGSGGFNVTTPGVGGSGIVIVRYEIPEEEYNEFS